MFHDYDKIELIYLRNVCKIQDKYIKDQINKKECEELLEIERRNYIIKLDLLHKQIDSEIRATKRTEELISLLGLG